MGPHEAGGDPPGGLDLGAVPPEVYLGGGDAPAEGPAPAPERQFTRRWLGLYGSARVLKPAPADRERCCGALPADGRLHDWQVEFLAACCAEAMGVAFIVLYGCGSVCSALYAGTQPHIFGIAATWGFGVGIAIYATASISGAHLNPAVSLAFAVYRRREFPWWKLPWYVLFQMLGGVAGGAINYGIWHKAIARFERTVGLVRGAPGSELSASAFGEYFPNPGLVAYDLSDPTSLLDPPSTKFHSPDEVTVVDALLVEAWGTLLLMFVILAVTHPKAAVLGDCKALAPCVIASVIVCNLVVYAPITQAGWNPARDFGPRLVSYFAGWGRIAIPGPRNGFWVYIVGPCLGSLGGGLLFDFLVGFYMQSTYAKLRLGKAR